MPEMPPGFVKKLRSTDYHFVLLVFFYVLHAWNDFDELLSVGSVLKITAFIVAAAFCYYFLSKIILKNPQKAALFTSFSFGFFLFFSLVEKSISLLPFTISGLTVKLSVFLMILLVFVLIYRWKSTFGKAVIYMNTVLLLFIASELIFLFPGSTTSKKNQPGQFVQHTTQTVNRSMPAVYLVLLDEYSGAETLERHGFYNGHFLNHLKSMGFKVVKNASSNYAQTAPSTASLLNGIYVCFQKNRWLRGNEKYSTALKAIHNNAAISTFQKLGYKIENFSPFRMAGTNTHYTNRFVPADEALLLSRTIFDDFIDLLPLFVARRFGNKKLVQHLIQKKADYNLAVIEHVLSLSAQKTDTPAFFYIHLMMPHAPFAKDSSGNVNVEFFMKKNINQQDKNNAYLQYLRYTNTVISNFIYKLKQNTKGEAVILLMSDHGSRDLAMGLTKNANYNALNCVYFPGSDSLKWYDGMSHVNQLRILFSGITGESIPLLKDSIAE